MIEGLHHGRLTSIHFQAVDAVLAIDADVLFRAQLFGLMFVSMFDRSLGQVGVRASEARSAFLPLSSAPGRNRTRHLMHLMPALWHFDGMR